jgi:hypothetical protein
MATTTETRTEKGISLARGPALILGTILLAAGLYFLYKAHTFPRFSNFPNGTAPKDGTFFLGIFGANGWTGELTAVGGGLLLFGAAQHLLAKTMSLIVGVALGAAAVIALISGNVLGMAAANGWTELGWAAVAAILLFNTALPRRRRTVATRYGDDAAAPVTEPVRRERTAVPAGGVADTGTETSDTRVLDSGNGTATSDTRVLDNKNGTATSDTRVVDPERDGAQATQATEPSRTDATRA